MKGRRGFSFFRDLSPDDVGLGEAAAGDVRTPSQQQSLNKSPTFKVLDSGFFGGGELVSRQIPSVPKVAEQPQVPGRCDVRHARKIIDPTVEKVLTEKLGTDIKRVDELLAKLQLDAERERLKVELEKKRKVEAEEIKKKEEEKKEIGPGPSLIKAEVIGKGDPFVERYLKGVLVLKAAKIAASIVTDGDRFRTDRRDVSKALNVAMNSISGSAESLQSAEKIKRIISNVPQEGPLKFFTYVKIAERLEAMLQVRDTHQEAKIWILARILSRLGEELAVVVMTHFLVEVGALPMVGLLHNSGLPPGWRNHDSQGRLPNELLPHNGGEDDRIVCAFVKREFIKSSEQHVALIRRCSRLFWCYLVVREQWDDLWRIWARVGQCDVPIGYICFSDLLEVSSFAMAANFPTQWPKLIARIRNQSMTCWKSMSSTQKALPPERQAVARISTYLEEIAAKGVTPPKGFNGESPHERQMV